MAVFPFKSKSFVIISIPKITSLSTALSWHILGFWANLFCEQIVNEIKIVYIYQCSININLQNALTHRRCKFIKNNWINMNKVLEFLVYSTYFAWKHKYAFDPWLHSHSVYVFDVAWVFEKRWSPCVTKRPSQALMWLWHLRCYTP